MKPKVSIITVVFNGENIIEKTMQSVLDQTYPNIEYIIVDGKSTDKTLQIIEKYKERIAVLISEKDKGLYDAMNKGLSAATGDYVWFMNGGDQINDADVLTTIFSQNIDADIFYSDTNLIDEEGKYLSLLSEIGHNNAPQNLTYKSMQRGMVVCHQSFIAKRDITSPFNLKYKISADIDWVIKCLKKSKLSHKLDFCLSQFMVGGVSSKNRWRAVRERFFLFNEHFGVVRNLYNHVFVLFRVIKTAFFR